MPDAICDLITGNIPGASPPILDTHENSTVTVSRDKVTRQEDQEQAHPNPFIDMTVTADDLNGAAITRQQAKRKEKKSTPLKVVSTDEMYLEVPITREEQETDVTLMGLIKHGNSNKDNGDIKLDKGFRVKRAKSDVKSDSKDGDDNIEKSGIKSNIKKIIKRNTKGNTKDEKIGKTRGKMDKREKNVKRKNGKDRIFKRKNKRDSKEKKDNDGDRKTKKITNGDRKKQES
ncbi:hypothetical protein Pcinc_013428 [Petrolisthes cinctipes]|uniref:Uncharacterized protein n=1 Tax=Petrolisthes cinctipes TaxID=88211 RepID=A0AAE1FX10_PETCI|nr:hypothetical protein Pcinc_013428 [Petrolisthes cinctipes]